MQYTGLFMILMWWSHQVPVWSLLKAYHIIQNEPTFSGSRWDTDFEWEVTEMDSDLAGHMSDLYFNIQSFFFFASFMKDIYQDNSENTPRLPKPQILCVARDEIPDIFEAMPSSPCHPRGSPGVCGSDHF